LKPTPVCEESEWKPTPCDESEWKVNAVVPAGTSSDTGKAVVSDAGPQYLVPPFTCTNLKEHDASQLGELELEKKQETFFTHRG
jgi:hypothetical protein